MERFLVHADFGVVPNRANGFNFYQNVYGRIKTNTKKILNSAGVGGRNDLHFLSEEHRKHAGPLPQ
jgi:hypothetical protein